MWRHVTAWQEKNYIEFVIDDQVDNKHYSQEDIISNFWLGHYISKTPGPAQGRLTTLPCALERGPNSPWALSGSWLLVEPVQCPTVLTGTFS